ncbi:hypothetical protein [Methanosarcina horonobensis]|uniref:hypothetical protein n=1 Tax=Methanosarcina horonobensis TaxID=418008 RepID=UPI00064F007D|nr:hypothetical protein [Methanosarcina horonobensis]
MVNSQTAGEIQKELADITSLASEIEKVPTFGVDVWIMKDVHRKCQKIIAKCDRISMLIGTGSGEMSTGTGTGYGGTGPGY